MDSTMDSPHVLPFPPASQTSLTSNGTSTSPQQHSTTLKRKHSEEINTAQDSFLEATLSPKRVRTQQSPHSADNLTLSNNSKPHSPWKDRKNPRNLSISSLVKLEPLDLNLKEMPQKTPLRQPITSQHLLEDISPNVERTSRTTLNDLPIPSLRLESQGDGRIVSLNQSQIGEDSVMSDASLFGGSDIQLDEEEGEGEYTGRYRTLIVPTESDPPSSPTEARRAVWGNPRSPFPFANAAAISDSDDEEEETSSSPEGGDRPNDDTDTRRDTVLPGVDVTARSTCEVAFERDAEMLPTPPSTSLSTSSFEDLSRQGHDQQNFVADNSPEETNNTNLDVETRYDCRPLTREFPPRQLPTPDSTRRRLRLSRAVNLPSPLASISSVASRVDIFERSEPQHSKENDIPAPNDDELVEDAPGMVKITSSDPIAAARATAILKLYNYDCYTSVAAPKRKNAVRYSDVVYLSGSPKGVPDDVDQSSDGVSAPAEEEEEEIEWTDGHWALLDSCFSDAMLELVDVDHIDVDNVADRFVDSVENGNLFDREELLGRVRVLQRRRRRSLTPVVVPSMFSLKRRPTMDAPTLGKRAMPPRKKPAPGMPPTALTAPRYSHLLDTPRTPSQQQQEDEELQEELFIEEGLSIKEEEEDGGVVPPTPSLTNRVKGFLFSYLPNTPSPAGRSASKVGTPGLPLPSSAPDLRSPSIPERPSEEQLKVPKDLVELEHTVTKTPEIVQRPIGRLVELKHVPIPAKDRLTGQRLKRKSSSVRDLVKCFEHKDA